MALRYVEYKRRQWVLRFRDPWSGKQRVRSFFTEAEAKAFEAVQAELYTRERELIRRARRRTSSASATRATVAELLGWYMETLENPTTRATSQQHVEPLTAIFGHRRAHCLTCDDVLAWCEVQRQRGVGQSTRPPPRLHPAHGIQLGRKDARANGKSAHDATHRETRNPAHHAAVNERGPASL